MSDRSNTFCPTPRCAERVAKYGDRYHKVYAKDHDADNCDALCEGCGGRLMGDSWVHACRECKAIVAPGGLVGLFVPHVCVSCEQKETDNQRRAGKVCRMCNHTYNRCCC